MDTPKVVVIVGETASGKSALALDIAEQFNGEIICADSRTVYKGMDIGTAKPSEAERAQIPHHLLDVVNPDESYSAAVFKQQANDAIDSITKRGNLPIIVGGTGLYIDALLFDYSFSAEGAKRDPDNPRHLERGEPVTKKDLRSNTLILGLHVEREVLKKRISDRIEAMVSAGFPEEVRRLIQKYGVESRALQAPGYKAFAVYCNGELSLADAKQAFIQNDLNLAKRQRTWFKRNKYIQWISDPREAVDIVTTFLNNHR